MTILLEKKRRNYNRKRQEREREVKEKGEEGMAMNWSRVTVFQSVMAFDAIQRRIGEEKRKVWRERE